MLLFLPVYKTAYSGLLLYCKSKCLKFPVYICAFKKQNMLYKNRVQAISVCSSLQHPIIKSEPEVKEGFIKRMGTKLRWVFREEPKVLRACVHICEACVDKVDCSAFIKTFELPDTFMSWFLITELHVWMCLVRAMREGKRGKSQRDHIIRCMWLDVQERMTKLGDLRSKEKSEGLELMSDQFRTAICAYDEGLNGSDKVLAAAIWRTLFGYDCRDPHYLEVLVHYVRKHITHLDNIDGNTYLYVGKIEWTPVDYFLKYTITS